MLVSTCFGYLAYVAQLTGAELELLEKILNKFIGIEHFYKNGAEGYARKEAYAFKAEILPAGTTMVDVVPEEIVKEEAA
jgi:hypothetical protein